MFNLKNKKIIITGASKGLGAVSAAALAEMEVRLVLMARTKSQLEEVRQSCRNPDNHLIVPADLTDPKELHKGIQSANEFLGGIDVALHIVGGGLGMHDPLLGANDFIKLLTLNLCVASEINRMIVPDMIKQGGGNLVHVASIASIEATGSVGYNTSKAALAAYVRSLGNQMAGAGIVVTGILPGGFHAPGNAMDRLEKAKPEIYKNFIEERLPRKFMGKAEEIVPLLLFLCSDKASMMGGCMVPVDAGEGKAYLQA